MNQLMGDFWVFGYGSLIWRPGFDFLHEERATIDGFHRALCIYSWVHRGTKEKPGLVLGLDHGGSCQGVARLVEAKKRDAVIAYLREREMVTDVYEEHWLEITLASGKTVSALTYTVNRDSEQYAGALLIDDLIRLSANSKGISGKNSDYVRNTCLALKKLDIEDKILLELTRRLDALHS